MPDSLAIALVVVVVALALLRLLLPALPLRGLARPVGPLDLVVAAVGVLGLVAHCGAMFFRSTFYELPGAPTYGHVVNEMGTGSIVLYVVPALLVILGLRHQNPAVLAVLALSLLAVGVTMYDHGPLETHLMAITVAVGLLALTGALLVARPSRRASAT